MKKIITILVIAILLTACGNSKDDKKKANNEEATAVEVEDNSLVKSLNYKRFVKDIWDIEKYPDSFAYQGKLPCIIDFYADWCGPCKKIAPIMEEIAKEYEDRLIIYKVNTDEEAKLSTIFEVKNIPTIYFMPVEGQPLKQVGARSKEEYISIINKHLIK